MKRLITLIFILFLLNACDRIKKTETETVVIDDVFTILDVEVTAGGININNPDGSDNSTSVGVTIEKFAYALTESEALEYIDNIVVTTELSDGTYSIKVENPDEDLYLDPYVYGGANLTFSNIDQQQLILRTTSGVIDCEEITQGDIDVTAGSVSVEKAMGPLFVDVTSGTIEIEEYWGDALDLETATGSMGVDIKGSGPIDALISAATGNILLDISKDRSCEVELDVAVGGIGVTGVEGYESITPFPGISSVGSFILNEGTGEINVNAAVGSIEVTVE